MTNQPKKLEKTLALTSAIGLAITMVVGSGLLVLPGLAYQQVGNTAIYAWLISAIVSIPILIIFAELGSKIPSAGGIAGFMQATFSRHVGLATEVLILGTIPGGAAIAITGGQYFATVLGGGRTEIIIGTILTLLVGGVVNWQGAKVSGRVQEFLSYALVIILGGVAILALVFGKSTGAGIAPISESLNALPAVGLVFFAFVGWELMSFTTEEFKNPQHDFPLMIATSFLVVVVLYALVAIAVQIVLPVNDLAMTNAPIAGLLASIGGSWSGKIIAAIGFFIVLMNFIGVVWAFSRLSFSSAREGFLPQALGDLATPAKIPRNAIIVVILAFAGFATVYFVGWVSQSLLFELAGESFFFSYILSVLAYLKRVKTWLARAFGVFTLIFTAGLFLSFGLKAFYPIVLFFGALALSGWIASRRAGSMETHN